MSKDKIYVKGLEFFFDRDSRFGIIFKIGVIKNFTNFTGKYVLESLFNKAVGLK